MHTLPSVCFFAAFKVFDSGKLKSWWVIWLGSFLHKASLCSPLKKKQGLICYCPCGENGNANKVTFATLALNERHSVRFANWAQSRDLIERWYNKKKLGSQRILLFSFSSKLFGKGASRQETLPVGKAGLLDRTVAELTDSPDRRREKGGWLSGAPNPPPFWPHGRSMRLCLLKKNKLFAIWVSSECF